MSFGNNFSPRQLSAFTATIIAIPISLGFYFFHGGWLVSLSWFAVILVGCYFLILTTLQRFIYRKIKLIYKLINKAKASKRQEFYYENILPKKGIDEVRKDVEDWARQRSLEIDDLKRNENFRREFLQNLSHELKTPLFAIQGYVDTLQQGALYDNAVNKKFLENASRNIDRLVNLVEDLDDISKLEGGNIKLNKTKFIIQDVIKDVFASLELNAALRGLNIFLKRECEIPQTVFADKEKIRHVLYNLTDNAIKYGRDNGSIEASVYNVDGKNVLIEISDDGAGIAESHLPRVFERFYRTDDARSRNIGGSGLGLSICKHIIEAHGENIHVRSKQSVGTTFGFTLKATPKV